MYTPGTSIRDIHIVPLSLTQQVAYDTVSDTKREREEGHKWPLTRSLTQRERERRGTQVTSDAVSDTKIEREEGS